MIDFVKIEDIKPADYNPRLLTDDAKARLLASISRLGLIKPIVLRRSDNRVIAGHQRSKCLRELGNVVVPCFYVDNVSSEDEVRFNQLHNRLEIEYTDKQPRIKVDCTNLPFGQFVKLPTSAYTIIDAGEKGGVARELSKLIILYGDFGSAVCDQDGNLIVSTIYALCSLLLGRDLYVYRLNKEQSEFAKEVFSQSYGEFNYDNIKRETYIQNLAQMYRLNGEDEKKQNCSQLYELFVIPKITKQMRVLDFAAGKKAYANKLAKNGYNIKALEFYYRDKCDIIAYNQVMADFDEIVEDIENNGLFDAVVCDSVLNSVDSPKAEISVLKTLQSLCKPNGYIFVSGRPIEAFEKDTKTSGSKLQSFYFFDKDGFTANLRKGHWFFQRGHTREEIKELALFFGKEHTIKNGKNSFQIFARNENRPNIGQNEDAISFEFTLPLPNGKRYALDGRMMQCLRAAEEKMLVGK